MALTTILEEVSLDSFVDQGNGYLVADMNTTANLVEGETYRVVWDGVEYECTAFTIDGFACVGNIAIVGEESSTQEPFLMFTMPLDDEAGELNVLMVATTDEGTTHTFTIYQEANSDIIVKDRNGNDVEYAGATAVRVRTLDGSTKDFVDGDSIPDPVETTVELDFSAGDMEVTPDAGKVFFKVGIQHPTTLIPGNIKVGETIAGITGEYEGEAPETEEMTVKADFSAGDMVLEPTEGKYLAKATVQKPKTLIPENIAEGVDIAGIIGNFIGGSDVKWASGTIEQASTASVTVEHGLGVIPDIFIVSNTTGIANGIIYNMCVSSAFADKYGIQISRCGLYAQSSAVKARYLYYNGNYMAALEGYMQLGVAGKGTAETVSIPGSTSIPIAAGTMWTAIAGLT